MKYEMTKDQLARKAHNLAVNKSIAQAVKNIREDIFEEHGYTYGCKIIYLLTASIAQDAADELQSQLDSLE